MPRSRSRSIESSTCARIARGSTVFVISRMRSASVDLPWSMWAMIEKLRMCAWSTTCLQGRAPAARAGRASAAPARQPRGDRVADLLRLGHAHREHREAIGGEADDQRGPDRDQLPRQRAADERVEPPIERVCDERQQRGRGDDPRYRGERLGALELAAELATQVVRLAEGHRRARDTRAEDDPADPERLV